MSSGKQVLAIETATNICSVCYQSADGMIFEERSEGRSIHSKMLFLSIQKLLKEHHFKIEDLDAVLISSGPGSYTGLRIAASGIKGLMFNSGQSVQSVNTLASFAAGVIIGDSSRIHAVIDARRTHLYHQLYAVDDGKLLARTDLQVKELEEIRNLIQDGDFIVGTGIDRLGLDDSIKVKIFGVDQISAQSLIRLFDEDPNSDWIEEVSVEDFDPNYFSSNQVNNSPAKQG